MSSRIMVRPVKVLLKTVGKQPFHPIFVSICSNTCTSMRAFLLVYSLLASLTLSAQIYNPVKWKVTLDPTADGHHMLVAKATIDNGWSVYSQHLDGDDGPIPTTLNFDEGAHYKMVGKNKESDNAKKAYDKLFEMNVTKFEKYYTIEQKIKVTDPSKPITGYVNFMTCNDERCLPPTDVDFELFASGGSTGAATPELKTTQPTVPPSSTSNTDRSVSSTQTELEKKKLADTDQGTRDVSSPAPVTFNNTGHFANTGLPSAVLRPAKWSFRSEKISDGVYDIIAEAVIEEGWHTYSGSIPPEGGPVPTTFQLDTSETWTPEGTVREYSSGKVDEFDKYFDMHLIKFKHDARLTQRIQSSTPGLVTGFLEFMACEATRCIAPEYIEFTVDLETGKEVLDNSYTASGLRFTDDGSLDQAIASLKSTYIAPLNDCGAAPKKDQSNMLWMFIFGMINGLVALLTPCVFPMIPLTVSFFTKDTKRKGWQNGAWYGASIILIYVGLGLLITVLFGAGSLNELSTNPLANTLFFLIFIFFAFSFFGFYEITLPSSWSNKSDAMADKGGLLGIFFMAATLAIVSFSCTGPLIGTALVEASSKGFMGPMVVMAGFSIALAVPFGLFAAFPAWLNSLPKSGGWMNSVKVMLGFAELALAFKFLSVADMTAHWGILKYELFMVLWVLVALGMAAYMFGLIRFPHDSPNRKLGPISATIALFFAGLGVYLATGLLGSEKTGTYNALGLMSGLAPPAHYNFFKPPGEVTLDVEEGRYISLGKCANNFDCFHDYYEGMAYAREQNKPVLLDFTGYGCVNCRKTEEHIWSRPAIHQKIREEFILVSLYVDDKMVIDSMLRSATTGNRIRTIGQKWTDFQIANFDQNSQPLYVILTPDEKVLTTPRGYDPDPRGYDAFLDCGLNAFKEYAQPTLGSLE